MSRSRHAKTDNDLLKYSPIANADYLCLVNVGRTQHRTSVRCPSETKSIQSFITYDSLCSYHPAARTEQNKSTYLPAKLPSYVAIPRQAPSLHPHPTPPAQPKPPKTKTSKSPLKSPPHNTEMADADLEEVHSHLHPTRYPTNPS